MLWLPLLCNSYLLEFDILLPFFFREIGDASNIWLLNDFSKRWESFYGKSRDLPREARIGYLIRLDFTCE